MIILETFLYSVCFCWLAVGFIFLFYITHDVIAGPEYELDVTILDLIFVVVVVMLGPVGILIYINMDD